MQLKIITTKEDTSEEPYSTDDCQQLINSMKEYYPAIGFNEPWVGYFVIKDNEVIGTGGFIV